MKFDEYINKNYTRLNEIACANGKDVIISECKDSEDGLQDVLITAFNKFGKGDFEEREIEEYIIKTLYIYLKVRYKRKDKVICRINDLRMDNDTDDKEDF